MNKDMKKQFDELQKKFENLKKDMKHFEKDTEQKIRENPVKSVAAAFGAGAVAGAIIVALFGRRR